MIPDWCLPSDPESVDGSNSIQVLAVYVVGGSGADCFPPDVIIVRKDSGHKAAISAAERIRPRSLQHHQTAIQLHTHNFRPDFHAIKVLHQGLLVPVA